MRIQEVMCKENTEKFAVGDMGRREMAVDKFQSNMASTFS
jgi:hypothetical protein